MHSKFSGDERSWRNNASQESKCDFRVPNSEKRRLGFPVAHQIHQTLRPRAGTLGYYITPRWGFNASTIHLLTFVLSPQGHSSGKNIEHNYVLTIGTTYN
jgi:hypothetical protein